MLIQDKIRILAEGAKYDVSCSSSGIERRGQKGKLGNSVASGICHSWSQDGRCISLLKILMSNACVLDCAYCVNRKSADVERATMSPEEVISLTMEFYRRNYIEGLFLSSGVLGTADETMLRMLYVVKKLRIVHQFNGYIHVKSIPGASLKLVSLMGMYVDRMSVNLEVADEQHLKLLAPDKDYAKIDAPMQLIAEQRALKRPRGEQFVPAGQSSQLMVGTGGDSDFNVLTQATRLIKQFQLKRVFYSAYIPVVQNNPLLPSVVEAPLLREHRLYQCDWLMRFYGFNVDEIVDESRPNLLLQIDPKAFWAIRNLSLFPVDVTVAPLDVLLRIPGVGPTSAKRIVESRRHGAITLEALKRMGVVIKRAKYFITIMGVAVCRIPSSEEGFLNVMQHSEQQFLGAPPQQISMLETHGALLGAWSKN